MESRVEYFFGLLGAVTLFCVLQAIFVFAVLPALHPDLSSHSDVAGSPVQEYKDISGIIDQFAAKPGDSSFIDTETFAKTLGNTLPSRFVRPDGTLQTGTGKSVTVRSLPQGKYLILFKGLSRSTCRLVVRNVINDARSPQRSAGTPALAVDARYNKGDFQAPCGSDQRFLALEGHVQVIVHRWYSLY